MIDLHAIRRRARRDLVIKTESHREDHFLWEHSVRVLETARMLDELPELADSTIDPGVLGAAALYHDAGWAIHFAAGKVDRAAILGKLTSPALREAGAVLMAKSLGKHLPARTLRRACDCVLMLNERDIDVPEARVIVEADNLDAFGAIALWQTARSHTMEGKSLGTVIDTWQTRKEYGYWEARIKDSFRFESVKTIARERVRVFDQMMHHLRSHHCGEDILAASGRSSPLSGQATTTV